VRPAGVRGAAWLASLLAIAVSTPVIAQQRIPVAGRVLRPGADSAPAPGVRLVLHRVGRSLQGPLDSVVSDTAGRFRLRFLADTTFLYLISANYAGIEYFSPPINTNPALPDTALVVAVFDTSSSQPVKLAARYLVIRRAAADGSRSVLDLIVLENRGAATRLAGDSVLPAWRGFVPLGVSGIRVGEADLSSDAITFRGDTILVFAPIAPGEKQIALEYALGPAIPLRLRFPEDSVATNVLVQDAQARVETGEMMAVDSQVIEGESFHRWVGAPHAGEELRVSFGETGGRVPGWLLPAMVGLIGVGLLAAVFRLRPRKSVVSLEALTDRIAELEARYAGRETEVSPEEWARYREEHDRLRAELSGHLASRRSAT
jgi:hypothetical protein